jgi:hypothetical protein
MIYKSKMPPKKRKTRVKKQKGGFAGMASVLGMIAAPLIGHAVKKVISKIEGKGTKVAGVRRGGARKKKK